MKRRRISKDEIDEGNPLLKDTLFVVTKETKVGESNKEISLEDDEAVVYDLMQNNFDIKNTIDKCLIDPQKMQCSLAIQQHRLGVNLEILSASLDGNKYKLLFYAEIMKEKKFTLDILEQILACDPIGIDVYDSNGFPMLIKLFSKDFKTENSSNSSNKLDDEVKFESKRDTLAIKFIDKFGDDLDIEYNNNFNNLFQMVCSSSEEVGLYMIEKYTDKIKLFVGKGKFTNCLISASSYKFMRLFCKMLETYGPELTEFDLIDFEGDTAILMFSNYAESNIFIDIVKKYKDRIVPNHKNNKGDTILKNLFDNEKIKGRLQVVLELFDIYGDKLFIDPEKDEIDSKELSNLLCNIFNYKITETNKNKVALTKLITIFSTRYSDYLDLSYKDKENDNLLQIAICCGQYELAKMLIERFGEKCQPDNINIYGNTALILSINHDQADLAILLINKFKEKCRPNQQNKKINLTALHIACNKKFRTVAFKLIDTFGDKLDLSAITKYGTTALLYAAWKNLEDVAIKIVENYSNSCRINWVNKENGSAIYFIVKNRMMGLYRLVCSTYNERLMFHNPTYDLIKYEENKFPELNVIWSKPK